MRRREVVTFSLHSSDQFSMMQLANTMAIFAIVGSSLVIDDCHVRYNESNWAFCRHMMAPLYMGL